jgi:glycosyltransferase involved in cell wall biosynthesis
MIIGLDGSRAFLKERTGVEEYSYQVIKNLADKLNGHEVILYTRNLKLETRNSKRYIGNLELPDNWRVKNIPFCFFWTQLGLSLEMFLHPVDALFISAHIVPLIHPPKTLVTIHGLEYEFISEAYPLWEKIYMRWAIKNSCRRAQKIIAVSENTKRDLVKLYQVPEEKIAVIYEGVNFETRNLKLETQKKEKSCELQVASFKPFLLFIGRLEERKNIVGIIQAFEILKEKHKIPHKLILAGNPGFNYKKIQSYLSNSSYKSEIILTGFVSEEEKQKLLKNAEVFLFPTFYEGFGLPILEAQNVGVPVVASNNSSISEVVKIPLLPLGEGVRRADEGFSAILINPKNPAEIAKATYQLITDKNLKEDMIKKGLENTKRFSWEKCAKEIAEILEGE